VTDPKQNVAGKHGLKLLLIALTVLISSMGSLALAKERKVTIIEPANGAKLTSPVKVCMKIEGLVVEPASNGVFEGRGHHHILFNSLPADLSQPIGKEEIHLGDGSTCREFKLPPGRHVIIAVFAYGNHVPYDPPVTDKIMITVKK